MADDSRTRPAAGAGLGQGPQFLLAWACPRGCLRVLTAWWLASHRAAAQESKEAAQCPCDPASVTTLCPSHHTRWFHRSAVLLFKGVNLESGLARVECDGGRWTLCCQ